MKNSIRIVSLLILAFLIAGAQNPTPSGINLFILSFDNFRSDPETEWLKEGFVDFLMDYFRFKPGVTVQRTTRIEATLDQLDKRPELKKERNFILTGNFQRINEQFEVNLQLTDINTWKTTEQQKVVVKTTDLAKIIEAVNQAAAGLIDPALKPPENEDAATAAQIAREMESFRETTAATKKIAFALDQLSGLYSEKPTRASQPVPQPVRVPNAGVNATDFSRRLGESLSQSATFEEILRRIVANPYQIEIGDPEFRRVTLNDELIRMAFVVRFTLNRELIQDMLSTFSYNYKAKSDQYTEYLFSGDRFIIPENLLRSISQGEFRAYPVISFLTNEGATAYSLIDVPVTFSRNIKPSPQLKFIAQYQPLVNVTASVTNVKIQLNNTDAEIRYEIELSREQLARISQMNITFLSESGLVDYLGKGY